MSSSEPPLSGSTAGPAPLDVDEVAAAARQQDPGLPPETASLLAGQAWGLLVEIGALDAPALARELMSRADVGATPAIVVATAAVAYCEQHGLTP